MLCSCRQVQLPVGLVAGAHTTYLTMINAVLSPGKQCLRKLHQWYNPDTSG